MRHARAGTLPVMDVVAETLQTEPSTAWLHKQKRTAVAKEPGVQHMTEAKNVCSPKGNVSTVKRRLTCCVHKLLYLLLYGRKGGDLALKPLNLQRCTSRRMKKSRGHQIYRDLALRRQAGQ